jgi:hypothetical protein
LVEPETILDEAKSLEEQQVSPCLWLNKITNLRFIHLHNCFSFIFPSYKISYLGFNVHIYELFIKRIHVYKKTSFIWKNITLSSWKVFLFELGGSYCQIDFLKNLHLRYILGSNWIYIFNNIAKTSYVWLLEPFMK